MMPLTRRGFLTVLGLIASRSVHAADIQSGYSTFVPNSGFTIRLYSNNPPNGEDHITDEAGYKSYLTNWLPKYKKDRGYNGPIPSWIKRNSQGQPYQFTWTDQEKANAAKLQALIKAGKTTWNCPDCKVYWPVSSGKK